jgi:tetratricopeptide (TPR) repeat protein
MKFVSILIASSVICFYSLSKIEASEKQAIILSDIETSSGEPLKQATEVNNFAGEFLSSHFAQSQHNWKKAKQHLDVVLLKDSSNEELLKRAMILAAGSGDIKSAVKRAKSIIEIGAEESFTHLILSIDFLSKKDFESAKSYVSKMPDDDISGFIKPIMLAWIEAELTQALPKNLLDNSVHFYHGALIALYLDNKKEVQLNIDSLMNMDGLSIYEGERTADLLVAIDELDNALHYYKGLQVIDVSHESINKKIDTLQNNKEAIDLVFDTTKNISPLKGISLAIVDLARILYQEGSDSSTQLFTQLAIVLDKDSIEARILLADTLARNERYQEAVVEYLKIPKSHDIYLETRHEVATLMAELGKKSEARDLLDNLYKSHNDVEAIIRIGDLYRAEEDYKNALKAYNRAAKALGNDIGEDYWHLLYARGMSYEREGKWTQAEKDLEMALSFRPNHPYILNYLGYSWADKGVNLEKSLELIEKAVSLRPTDGYIVDSLGWVYYMLGRYEEALPYLEKAAELLSYDPVINDHLGDVYWQVGRKLEARFQWERAINYNDDPDLAKKVQEKLKNGLQIKAIKAAKSELE